MVPAASASAVPGRSASRPANCTSRLAPPRDCFKSPRSTSAARASPSRAASAATVSARTPAKRASQRPTRPKRSSSRSPPRDRNPDTSASSNPSRCAEESSPAPGATPAAVGDAGASCRPGRRPGDGLAQTFASVEEVVGGVDASCRLGACSEAGAPVEPAPATAAGGVRSEKRFRSVIGGSPRERVVVGFGSAGPTSRLGKLDPHRSRSQ